MAAQEEHRAAWSAAGGVLMLAFVALATVAWQAGQSTRAEHRQIPEPAFVLFVVGAAVALYFMVAPLLHWPPFRRASASKQTSSPSDDKSDGQLADTWLAASDALTLELRRHRCIKPEERTPDLLPPTAEELTGMRNEYLNQRQGLLDLQNDTRHRLHYANQQFRNRLISAAPLPIPSSVSVDQWVDELWLIVADIYSHIICVLDPSRKPNGPTS